MRHSTGLLPRCEQHSGVGRSESNHSRDHHRADACTAGCHGFLPADTAQSHGASLLAAAESGGGSRLRAAFGFPRSPARFICTATTQCHGHCPAQRHQQAPGLGAGQVGPIARSYTSGALRSLRSGPQAPSCQGATREARAAGACAAASSSSPFQHPSRWASTIDAHTARVTARGGTDAPSASAPTRARDGDGALVSPSCGTSQLPALCRVRRGSSVGSFSGDAGSRIIVASAHRRTEPF